jgi:hypothetical protein
MSSERLWSLHDGGHELPASVVRWLAAAMLTLLSAAAVVVLWRRLAGALPHPLQPAPLLALAIAVAIAAGAIRLGWPLRCPAGSAPRAAWIPMIGASLAVAALGIAVSARAGNVAALLAFWTMLLLEEGWAWQRVLRRTRHIAPVAAWLGWRRMKTGTGAAIDGVSASATVQPIAEPVSVFIQAPQASTVGSTPQSPQDKGGLPSDDVAQQFVRRRAADGSDTLSGFARLVFAPAQRTGSVHVAFCPPFARTPELSVAQIDGPEARIKTGQLLPYGVRLDLKLTAEAEQPISVLLRLMAREGAEAQVGQAPRA